jgi:RNA polymerase sigma-70 factor (ECF subfamily)
VRVIRDYSDAICLQLLQADDARGLDALFDQHAAKLTRFAASYLSQVADADEVVQECFVRLWEHRHELDAGTVFKTYLYTTAYRQVLNQLRRQRSWQLEDLHEATALDTNTPSRLLEQQELEQVYAAGVAQLPQRRREIFALSRQQGLSNVAIAQQLNVSVKCVENQMTQALRFLRLYFRAHGVSLMLALLLLDIVATQ